MINLITRNLNYYVEKLENGEPFALARYGDGEFAAMFKEPGENCDGHHYFPEMGEDLTATFRMPCRGDYEYGILDISYTSFGRDRVFGFLEKIVGKNILLTDGDAMVIASKTGKLFPLISALKGKKILYVGPGYLRDSVGSEISSFFNDLIEVPLRDSYLMMGDILRQVRRKCHDQQYDLIGFSAGPPTKIMMWRLWPTIIPRTTMIDFGSLWDGFAGRNTRRYHQEKNWRALISSNLYGEEGKD